MTMARAALAVLAGTVGCRQLLSIDELEGVAEIDAPASDGAIADGVPAVPDAADDAAPPPDALVCPSGYVEVTGQLSKYRVVATTQSWTIAESDCENDGPGTHLVVIDDAAEDLAIDALSSATSIWIGVSDRVAEGTYRNVTGPATAFFDWAAGDPDSGANGDCVAIIGTTWEDGSCTSSATAICECDGIPADQSAF